MAHITFEFEGLKELQKQLEILAADSEMRATNKEIFQQCADVTQPRMKAHMAKSSDNSKSGRRGYRPAGHASDNIPVKVTTSGAEVGWTLLGDAENWFYMKFVEWGTSRQPPQDFLHNTLNECGDDYSRIAETEYQKLLDAKIGG